METRIAPSELLDIEGLMAAVEIAQSMRKEHRQKQEAIKKAKGRGRG